MYPVIQCASLTFLCYDYKFNKLLHKVVKKGPLQTTAINIATHNVITKAVTVFFIVLLLCKMIQLVT
jgi:hypothetical protein